MQLKFYDISMPSINPTSLTGTSTSEPTGGGNIIIGSSTTPGLPYPTVEGIYRVVADANSQTANSAAVPAGQILTCTYPTVAPFNYGAAAWGKVTANQQSVARFNAGVVVSPPVPFAGPNGVLQTNVPGGQSLVCVQGPVVASVTTSAARAPGVVLTLGLANNNLVDVAPVTPFYGQAQAVLLQAIAGASTSNVIVNFGYN